MVSTLKLHINAQELTILLFLAFRYQMLGEINSRECEADGWTNDIPLCEGKCKIDL